MSSPRGEAARPRPGRLTAVVALQDVDVRRARSGAEEQAEVLARRLATNGA